MKYKSRILELIKDAPEDIKKLTVGQLIKKFTKELKKEQKIETDRYAEVIATYKGTYIKVREEDSFFGGEVIFIHIKDIKTGDLTTEWERLFDIGGHKISFSDYHSSSKKIDSKMVANSMSAKDLNKAKKITEVDFDEAMQEHKNLQKIIKKMQK